MFMGEKDYQQFYLVQNFISKKYTTKVNLCRTIRNANGVALSSRNRLLNKSDMKTSGLIANKLIKLKQAINKKNDLGHISSKKSKELIKRTKNYLISKFNIKIEYMECRNLNTLTTNINNKPFKLFISYYLNNIRLIDLRETHEYALQHDKNFENNVPLTRLVDFVHQHQHNKQQQFVLVCRSGSRSQLAAQAFLRLGFEHVGHLKGGYALHQY